MTFGFTYLRKGEEDFDSVRYVAYGCAPAPGSYCGNGPQLFTANQGTGGDAFAEVLLGLPSVIHQRFNYTSGGPFAPEPNVVVPYYGGYFNDKGRRLRSGSRSPTDSRYELPIPIFRHKQNLLRHLRAVNRHYLHTWDRDRFARALCLGSQARLCSKTQRGDAASPNAGGACGIRALLQLRCEPDIECSEWSSLWRRARRLCRQ